MDFTQIVLTRSELKALRKCRTKKIPLSGNERLVRLRLAEEIIDPVPGLFGSRTGEIRITDPGRDFLLYIDGKQADERADRRHDWLIALLSTFGGALLSQPLWDLITFVLRALQAD